MDLVSCIKILFGDSTFEEKDGIKNLIFSYLFLIFDVQKLSEFAIVSASTFNQTHSFVFTALIFSINVSNEWSDFLER